MGAGPTPGDGDGRRLLPSFQNPDLWDAAS